MGTTVEIGVYYTTPDAPYFRLNSATKGRLNNASYRLAGAIYYDITDRVRSVNISRGKNRELDRYSAGQVTVSLNNDDRYFDPLNTESFLFGSIIPRRQLRVRSGGFDQFVGVIDDWNYEYDVSGQSLAAISASDNFVSFAQQSLTAGTASVQTSGARIDAVLSQPSVAWPLDRRQVDVGNAVLSADVFDGNVLSYLQQVEASEQGQLFMTRDGDVRFVDGATAQASTSWPVFVTNLVTNPSMETVTAGTTTLRTNLVTNPSFEVDATGYKRINTGSPLTTRVTTQAYSGTASLEVAYSNNDGAFLDISGLSASTTYTFSVWVKGTAGDTVRADLNERVDGTTSVGTTNGTATTLTGSWQRLTVTRTFSPTGVYARLLMRNTATTMVGATYWDAVMLEQTDQVRDYFDGSTTSALGWDYGWSGTANASTSTAKATPVTVQTNYILNPAFEVNTTDWAANEATTTISRDTVEFYSSPASLKVVTTLAGGGTYKLNTAVAGLTAGAKFSGSAWVKAAAGTPLRFSVGSQGTGAVTADNFFTATGAWQYVKAENATLGTSLNPYVFVISTASTGVTFYVDNVMLNMGSTVATYFNGSTGVTGDAYVNAWTGTANASTSIQQGVAVANIADTSTAVSMQSNEWASTGSRSVRITSTSSSTGSWSRIDLTTTVGTTYTAKAKIRLEAAQTGTLSSAARKLVAYDSSYNALANGVSAQAPNTAGVTELSVTFVATTTTTRIVMWNGASAGNGEVWWDDLLVVEGTYTGDYFDGSTADTFREVFYWTGTPNASTSIAKQSEYIYFADDTIGIPYTGATVSYGTELLYNQITVTFPAGTAIANNTSSQASYGIISTDIDSVLSNDTQATTLAEYLANKYGQPEYRFEAIQINLLGVTGDQANAILQTELGDIAAIRFTPNGVGSPIERACIITSIKQSIGVDSHIVSLGFASIPFSSLVLDDYGFGILDSNTLSI